MEVVGIVLIPAYLFWEWKFAKYPVVPKRFVTNKAVVIASLIGAFDFVRLTTSYPYTFSLMTLVSSP